VIEKVKILSLNIGNPSLERAKKQCEWLAGRPEDIFVLTETKESKGCGYIKEYFGKSAYTFSDENNKIKYFIDAPQSQTGDLGVILISRHEIFCRDNFFPEYSIYFSRQLETGVRVGEKEIHVAGLYVPSRDRSERKILRKKRYIDSMEMYLKESPKVNKIIMGDFNILERMHVPHYSTFYEWEYHFYDALLDAGYIDAFRQRHPDETEYSWVGRTNNGYRYDYCFVSADLQESILDCRYVHETRDIHITDHSAITVEVAI